jgi:hypothetical protein
MIKREIMRREIIYVTIIALTVTTDGTTEEINLHSNKFKEGGKFRKHCHGLGNGGKG